MLSSFFCRKMIKKYSDIKTKVLSLYGDLDTCLAYITQGMPYIESLVVNKEPVDKGKLLDLSDMLSTTREALNTIVAECALKEEEYQYELTQAIAREKELALSREKTENSFFEISMD